MLYVLRHDDKLGAVDATGRVVIPFAFWALFPGDDGRLAFCRDLDSRWGYFDETGAIAIPEQFAFAQPFSGGLAAVALEGSGTVFIDPSGEQALEPTFSVAHDFAGDHALASLHRRWGVVDRRGEWVVEPRFEDAGNLADGLFSAKRGKKWGLVSVTGEERSPFKYVELGRVAEARAAFRRGKQWGLLDEQGSEIVAPRFEAKLWFNEGIAAAKEGGQLGLIDRRGDVRVPCDFDELLPPAEGLSPFRRGAERGFLRPDGDVVIQGSWIKATAFQGGLAVIDDARLIDLRGEVVAEVDFGQQPTIPTAEGPDPLAYDPRELGPYLAALVTVLTETTHGTQHPEILEQVDPRHPDALKAFLVALSRVVYFHLGPLAIDPKGFHIGRQSLRFGEGDFGATYWIEHGPGQAKVIERRGGERYPRSDLEGFFQGLWEHGLNRGRPLEPQASEYGTAYAEALARIRADRGLNPASVESGTLEADGSSRLTDRLRLVPSEDFGVQSKPPRKLSDKLEARGRRGWLYHPGQGVLVARHYRALRYLDPRGSARALETKGRITAAGMAPDGSYVAFAEHRTLARLSLPDGAVSEPFEAPGAHFFDLAVLPDHTVVVAVDFGVQLARFDGTRYALGEKLTHPALPHYPGFLTEPDLEVVFVQAQGATLVLLLDDGEPRLVGPTPEPIRAVARARQRKDAWFATAGTWGYYLEGTRPAKRKRIC